MTYEEFLVRHDGEHVEWVDGEVVEMSPVTSEHARVVAYLQALLRVFAEQTASGEVFGEPFHMKTGPDLPGRSPDVIFVANDRTHTILRMCLAGPANLAIEVVSPDSLHRDREEKFAEYERGGVGEYWIVDPDARTADFYQRNAEGRYQAVPADTDGVYRSREVPWFWLRVDWLWQRPPVLSVLRELGVL